MKVPSDYKWIHDPKPCTVDDIYPLEDKSMINVGEVAMIATDCITVGERARGEMGDLEEFESNMKERGLISPLAVKSKTDGTYELLAGERRFRILSKNKVEAIPCRIFDNTISEIEMKSIELSENFYRKDFEYYEHDALVEQIHNLQQEIHGEKISTAADATGWGMKDTARMVGKDKSTISYSIKRAKAREAFPALFDKCKTQQDASKMLKKLDEQIIKDVLVSKIDMGKVSSNVQQLVGSFIQKDFFEGIEECPDNYFNFVEIDPPYAINIDGSGEGSAGKKDYAYGEDYNEVAVSDYKHFMRNVFASCYRTMAEHSWLICWFAPEPWFETIYVELINAGFSTTRMCGIWTKGYGQSKRPEIHLANSYEMFFYAWKGRPAMAKAGRTNTFDFKPVPSQYKTHPTERPIELTTEIYSTFTWPGTRVLIPFLGSGNGLLSAHELGMTGLGFELSKAYRDSFLVKTYKM